MDADELKMIFGIFREEVRDLSRQITADLLVLEASPGDSGTLERLFRAAHTLKGVAGSLGQDRVAALAHSIEGILSASRDQGASMGQGATDSILEALDEVTRLVEAARPADGGPEAEGRETPGVPSSAPSGTDVLKVALTHVTALGACVDELVMAKLRLAQRVSDSQRLSQSLERLARTRLAGESALEVRRTARLVADLSREMSLDNQRLDGLSEEIRDVLQQMQLVPTDSILEPFRRSVREHAKTAGVDVVLEIAGGGVTADRRILEGLRGALVHLLRNAVDHGIERSEERKAAGKDLRARLSLSVQVAGPTMHISVSDDGRGIDPSRLRKTAVQRGVLGAKEAEELSDEQAMNLIWRAGFSTASKVTETAGRGVGLDAVRNEISRQGGRIEVRSRKGEGTTFHLKMPLLLAATLGLLVEAGGISCVIPLTAVEGVRRVSRSELGHALTIPTIEDRGRALPVFGLAAALTRTPHVLPREGRFLVCTVGDGDRSIGLMVDRILGEREISVQPLGPELHRYAHLAGATRTGDGRLLLVLSAEGIVARALGEQLPETSDRPDRNDRVILVAEDSVASRLLYRASFEEGGFRVLLAADGQEALDLAQSRHVDGVVTDVRMPRMDGLELTRQLRRLGQHAETPVILVTSLASDEDRREGLRAGATAYLVKKDTTARRIVEAMQGFVK